MALERADAEIDAGDHVMAQIDADMLGLAFHLLHQPRALDRLGKTWIILDVGGDHQLPAGLQAHEPAVGPGWRARHRCWRYSRPGRRR